MNFLGIVTYLFAIYSLGAVATWFYPGWYVACGEDWETIAEESGINALVQEEATPGYLGVIRMFLSLTWPWHLYEVWSSQ